MQFLEQVLLKKSFLQNLKKYIFLNKKRKNWGVPKKWGVPYFITIYKKCKKWGEGYFLHFFTFFTFKK